MARGLRNATQEIEFRDVSARSIVPVLRDICRKEGIEFESDALERIAERNRGDLRGAINDLQAGRHGGARFDRGRGRGHRRPRQGARAVPYLDAVLKEESAEEALQSAYAVDETPDDLTKWIENNVLDVYDPSEVVRAYDFLANADVWLGRVRATQNYSYWRYATDNAAAGVAAARDGTKGGWTRYGRPQFWSPSDATADEVVGQIAAKSGCSVANRASRGAPVSGGGHPPLQAPRELTVAMAAAYDLDEAGIAFVTGSGESTNKVASIAEDAQRSARSGWRTTPRAPSPAAATQRTTSERRTARRRMRAVQRAVPATTGTRTGQPTATEAMLTTGTTTMTTGRQD